MITFVICTYDRPALLADCLAGLVAQTIPPTAFDVLVVDNHPNRSARSVADRFEVRYCHEPTPGLSHARNRGARTADTAWVFYLDDDAVPHPTLVANFLETINQHRLTVLGGRFFHRYPTPPPPWLYRYHGDGHRPAPGEGLIELASDQYLIGCVMAFRREILLRFPFRTDLGMLELRPGYGEETELQDRLRVAGISVYYHSGLVIDHLIQPAKYRIRHRIDMAYAHGRSTYLRANEKPSATRGLKELVRTLFITLPYDLTRIVLKPGFHWQNGVISTLGKLAFLRGKYGY